ncbi:lipoprotein, putative [Pseudoalteromonas luteoviolacea B = ATCC 29581]|nr:lipoprotein, putative [Pseudoalteromonas luteoviolacea B = ATCC 29581]
MKKFIIIAMALGLAACSKVNLENYNKITVGMDRTEVEQFLGSADKCEEKTLHTACVWGNETKNIEINFVSNKVTIYTKEGIEQ